MFCRVHGYLRSIECLLIDQKYIFFHINKLRLFDYNFVLTNSDVGNLRIYGVFVYKSIAILYDYLACVQFSVFIWCSARISALILNNMMVVFMNDFIIVIPARMNSTRLPNKMMLLIGEQPVIEHTWRQAISTDAKKVIVATDNELIFNHMQSIGAEVVMTSAEHPTGTDRLAEVALIYGFNDEEIIVNWQGDEPFLPYQYIEKVARRLEESPKAAMSTLATNIDTWDEFLNVNVVKIVHNNSDEALYFSRAPIPFPRGVETSVGMLPKNLQSLRHIGVYGYRAFFLKAYPMLKLSPLEQLESLEQLRALSNGYSIVVEHMDTIPPVGIDTEVELAQARQWYATNH